MSLKSALSGITQDQVRTERSTSFAFNVPSIGTITCKRILRTVKSKRVTCIGEHGNNRVLVKLFFHSRRAKNHWKRSDKGCRIFTERSITAPKIIYSGYLSEHKIYVIVFEYIENAVSFGKALAFAHNEEERQELLDRLIGCLAMHHQQGIIQDDLHVGNFLLRGKEIYSLDGDHVRSYRRYIGKCRSLANLGKLLSYFFPINEATVKEKYQVYCSERGWQVAAKDTRRLVYLSERILKRRSAKSMRKIYRHGSTFSVCNKQDYYSIRNLNVWNDKFKLAFDNPERIISEGDGEQLDGTYQYHLSIDNSPIILYSARVLGIRFLRRFNIISQIWRNAHRLNRLKIHTHRPVALIEKRESPIIWRAFLIVESSEGMLAREFFTSDSVSSSDKYIVAERIAKALLVMKQTGIAIRGVSSTNILVLDLEPVFLDVLQLNRRAFYSRASVPRGVREFLRGWDDEPTIRMLFLERFRQLQLI